MLDQQAAGRRGWPLWPVLGAVLAAFLLASAAVSASDIMLTDGTVLKGEIVGAEGGQFVIRLDIGAELRIPIEKVRQAGAGGNAPPGQPARRQAVLPANGVALRLAGSNTIGEELAPRLAQAFVLAQGMGQGSIQEGANAGEKSVTFQGTAGQAGRISIEAHGSSTAFKALNAGTADIGMSSRRINDKEILDLAPLGTMTGPEAEHVAALDGLAIVVNQANPLRSLTLADMARIFSGTYTDWSQVPGSGTRGPINVFARNESSGTWDTFKTLVLNEGKIPLIAGAQRLESSEELSRAVASYPSAIGFIGLAYVKDTKPVAIDECGLEYQPDEFAVKTEEYPLFRRLYLYQPPSTRHAVADAFVEHVLSNRGQATVGEVGFVNLLVTDDRRSSQRERLLTAAQGAVDPAVYAAFARMTAGARRLSVTFRFEYNSSELDNRARRDVARLVEYARGPGAGRELLLLGLTDSVGNYAYNRRLAQQRAQRIASMLQAAGVRTGRVDGFGPEAPVACQDTPTGQAKNRHVEVWVR